MRRARRKSSNLAVVAALFACLGVGPGCRGGSDSPASQATQPNLHRYTVRGEVTHLATASEPRRVSLRHEPIEEFKNEAGVVVGMPSMVMPFELGKDVDIAGLEVGDKVEMRFAVGWSPSSLKVEELRKLPDDVQLRFGDASSDAPSQR